MAKTRETRAALNAERRAVRDEALARVKATIDADPTANYSMRQLPRIAMMGQWYFQHQFQIRYGISPRRYVTRAKFALACRILAVKTPLIATLTHEVGYNSMGTFSQNFKRTVGCSPSKYRGWVDYAAELGTPTQP